MPAASNPNPLSSLPPAPCCCRLAGGGWPPGCTSARAPEAGGGAAAELGGGRCGGVPPRALHYAEQVLHVHLGEARVPLRHVCRQDGREQQAKCSANTALAAAPHALATHNTHLNPAL